MNSPSSNPASTLGHALDSWFTLPRFALFLLAVLFAAFPSVWLGTESFFRSDYGVLAYPFVHYHRESIWSGELPLWNPLSNCGAPFLAQWGTMVLYPGTLFYVLFPLPWSLGVFCLLHLWLGGLGMFKLAERWTNSRFAAAAAGTVFVFNGITLACLIWPNYTVALGWMPWVVLLVERAWKEGGRTVVLAALAASMQMLAGTPEIVVFTWLVLGAIAIAAVPFGGSVEVGRLALRGVAGRSATGATSTEKLIPAKAAGHWSLVIGHSLLIITLVSALCAAQLLPFFDLLAHSQRDPSQAVGKWALPAWGWANLLVPMFRCAMSPQQFYFMQGQEFLTSCYVGAAALALAVLAVWKVRDRRVWLLAALAVFAVLMAMGPNGPLFPLVQKVIPVVGIARYPVKFMILVAFVVSLLVAFGVKWCLSRSSRGDEAPSDQSAIRNPQSAIDWQPLLVIATLLPAVALLVLWWMRGHPLTYDRFDETVQNTVGRMIFFGLTLAMLFQSCRAPRERTRIMAGFAALAFIAADGLTHLKNQNPTIFASLMTRSMAGFEKGDFAWVDLQKGRLFLRPAVERELLTSGEPNWNKDFAKKRRAFWSNLNAIFSVAKVNGSSTLRIREQDEIQSFLYSSNSTDSGAILRFLGAWVVQATPEGTPEMIHGPMVTSVLNPSFGDVSERLSTFRYVTHPSFDPHTGVVLPAEARSLVTNIGPTTHQVIQTHGSAHRVEAEAIGGSPSLVVIAQTFYHPWKAYVDEKPVPLLRANHAFQALEVPAGTHRVRLAYEDRKFRIGCFISLTALVVCGGLWCRKAKDE